MTRKAVTRTGKYQNNSRRTRKRLWRRWLIAVRLKYAKGKVTKEVLQLQEEWYSRMLDHIKFESSKHKGVSTHER